MLLVRQGTCHASFMYDVGWFIDLGRCEKRLEAGERAPIIHRKRAPTFFQFEPPPLRVSSGKDAELVVYDFGAVSLTYAIPFAGEIAQAAELAVKINEGEGLRSRAREELEAFLRTAGDAIHKPRLIDDPESYLVLHASQWDASSLGLGDACRGHAEEIARLLRSETDALSSEIVSDAIASRISYGPADLTFIGYDAALVFDDEDAADVRAVLEFANIQLLELRSLDRQLDESLDAAYERLSLAKWRLPGTGREDLRRIGQMQVDGAVLFERVTNALKLFGDQYLALVYRLASDRLHLGDWTSSIQRKLQTIESIYQKMSDRASGLRMELLEWVIIVLIAISIAIPFLGGPQ